MRLSPDVVAEAPQALNCIGDRELSLRDRAIPVIENLATARDSFDTIDLSGNAITDLTPGCLPPFPRLGSLYVGSNRIRAVHSGFADSIPNLHTLILTCNAIESVEDFNVPELAKLRKLEVLAFTNNPVAADAELGLLLVHQIPSLRFINFQRVSQADHAAALEKHGPRPVRDDVEADGRKKKKQKKRRRAQKSDHAGPQSANGEISTTSLVKRVAKSGKKSMKPAALTSAQVEAVKDAIANASSIDEVMALQEAMQAGDVGRVLQLIPSSS